MGRSGMVGWLKRLFVKRKTTAGQVTQDLIQLYGVALEAHAASGSAVSDVSKLPAPKDTMKVAIRAAIASTKDATMREQLRTSYVMLSEFQPGVGAKVIRIDTKVATTEDTKDFAKRVATQAAVFSQWMRDINLEGERLLKELGDTGGSLG